MRFAVLGPLEVHDDDQPPVRLGGRRQQAVLALLLVAGSRAASKGRLIDEIWGESAPDGARDSLYTYVSNLRHLLGRERIVRTEVGYRLQLHPHDQIDAAHFEARLAEARRVVGVEPARAATILDDAMRLWRGQPFQGLDVPSVTAERVRLVELRLGGWEDLMEAELRKGSAPDVSVLEALTRDHPYRERFWELLARALYRRGRQADALASLSRVRRLLRDELGVDPSPTVQRLEQRILVQDPTLDSTPPGTRLPAPLGEFVGRAGEMAMLEQRLGAHRLVTLLGPGGAGKSRLAAEFARRIGGAVPDGVWMADLTSVAQPNGVADAIAATVGVALPPERAATVLAGWARGRRALLVLDNCEHVVGRAAELAGHLVAEAPGLQVLATSRVPLQVEGEMVVPVDGLPIGEGPASVGDAERLFAERARALRPGFRLDESTRPAVTELCRRLDGLPLAIELAAARINALGPSEIADHLGDRFSLLTTPHPQRPVHTSLQASLDWSRSLLELDQQRALDAIGVFEGPFTARSAAAAMDDPLVRVMELLSALVDASLLTALPGEPSHYQLPETVRLFARDHLHRSGRWTRVLRRHDAYRVAECAGLRDDMFGRGRIAARMALEGERAGYEAALDRALADGRTTDALTIAWPLGNVWLFSGALRSGLEKLERIVTVSTGSTSPARADVLSVGAFLTLYVQRFSESVGWADEAASIYRLLGDDRGLAYALARRGHAAFATGDLDGAVALLRESLDACDRIGYEDGRAWPLTLLAQARLWAGDESDEVRRMLEQGRRLFIEIGDAYGQIHATTFLAQLVPDPERGRYLAECVRIADLPSSDPLMRPLVLHNYAFTAWNRGDRAQALGLNRMSAQSAADMGVTISSGMALLQAAQFAGVTGESERAAVLRGAGERHFTMQMAPFWDKLLRPGVDAARRSLGEDHYNALHARGYAMTVEIATDYLLHPPNGS